MPSGLTATQFAPAPTGIGVPVVFVTVLIGVTVFGLLLTPVFYVLVQRDRAKVQPAPAQEVVSHV